MEFLTGITLRTSDSDKAQQISSKVEKAEKLEMPDVTKEVSGYIKENGTVYNTAMDFGADAASGGQALKNWNKFYKKCLNIL